MCLDQSQPEDWEGERCAHIAVYDEKKAYARNKSHKVNLLPGIVSPFSTATWLC